MAVITAADVLLAVTAVVRSVNFGEGGMGKTAFEPAKAIFDNLESIAIVSAVITY